MKKIITLLAVFITIAAVAQQPSAPVKVSKVTMNKFKSVYPTAANVTWTQTEDGKYVAHFKENDKNRWITFDEQNDWMNSMFEIERTDLPPAAIAALDQWYTDATFILFYKFIDETGVVHFEADRDAGEMVAGPVFDANGNAYSKAARPKGERPLRIN